MDTKEKISQAADLIKKAHEQMYQIWLSDILFTWRWWLGTALSIIPWVIWVKYRKKDSTYRLLLAGAFTIIATSLLDFIGSCYKLWYYDSKVLPLIPTYIPWDFTLFPVSVMFILQLKPKVNRFVKALLFSFVNSFVFEKIFAWAGFYFVVKWSSFYSFPIYIIIYLLADFFSRVEGFEKLN